LDCSDIGHPAFVEHKAALAMREANQALLLSALEAGAASEAARDEQGRQTEFLHRLAHELRGPLSPLRHACALLAQPPADATLQVVRAIIDRQVDHLAQLVDDLMDAARLRTGRLSLRLVAVDLRDVLAVSVQTCQALADLRAQSLVLDLPSSPVPVLADPLRLAQVFGNLLSNASKYTPHGGHITLGMVTHADCADIRVVDDGIGITPQALHRIFDAYMQEAHAVRHDASGLGLGLTLARELVLAHGGCITASSAGPGLGTCIDVRLPLQAAPAQAAPA
jgi:signal transduction histidine kinase